MNVGGERTSNSLLGTRTLEVEAVVQAVVRVPPLLSFNRESDANEQLTFVELSSIVFEFDVEAESIPSLVTCRGRWDVRDVITRDF